MQWSGLCCGGRGQGWVAAWGQRRKAWLAQEGLWEQGGAPEPQGEAPSLLTFPGQRRTKLGRAQGGGGSPSRLLDTWWKYPADEGGGCRFWARRESPQGGLRETLAGAAGRAGEGPQLSSWSLLPVSALLLGRCLLGGLLGLRAGQGGLQAGQVIRIRLPFPPCTHGPFPRSPRPCCGAWLSLRDPTSVPRGRVTAAAWESPRLVPGSPECNAAGEGEASRQLGGAGGGGQTGSQSLDRLGGWSSRKLLSQAGGRTSERESAGRCSLQGP